MGRQIAWRGPGPAKEAEADGIQICEAGRGYHGRFQGRALPQFDPRVGHRLLLCSISELPSPANSARLTLSEKPIELLGGRLSVRMPQGPKIMARSFNIMSAPESEEHETRVVFDAGQERLVLMAHGELRLRRGRLREGRA